MTAPHEGPTEPQRLFLHVGLPKSGSTFIQSVLGGNRFALREHGFVYPYVRQEGMFYAAVEMTGHAERWGLDPDDIAGTFAHLLRRGRRLGGTVVLSHENFGGATPEQVEVMRQHLEGFEVHVVVTVRNVGRTATAQWQERVKNGGAESFDEFFTELVAQLPDDPGQTRGFWRPQNLQWLLERWAPVAPPERTHVVVTPSGPVGPEVLWQRFAEAIGLPAGVVDLSGRTQGNESLGTAQIAFMRQVVTALDGRLEQPWFSRVAKRWFAQTVLSTVRSPKPVTPPEAARTLTTVTRTWIDVVRTGGYRVHGDLDELLPEPAPPGTPHPDQVTPEAMLDGLDRVVAEMLLRTRDDRARIAELEAAGRDLAHERDELRARVAELAAELESLPRWWRLTEAALDRVPRRTRGRG